MSHSVLALFLRSLRTDARYLPLHMLWFGLLLGIYGALWMAISSTMAVGAPGLNFLRGIAWVDIAVLCLLGTPFFSSAVAEEREEDTLGLMRMAGISSLGLLLGKSTGRLIQVLLLMAIQYPFLLLAITLGGVVSTQLSAFMLGLSAFAFALANVGLLCSVLCPTIRSAAIATGACLAVHLGLAFVARSIAPGQSLDRYCLVTNVGDILSTGFAESIWSNQVVSNMLVGLGCFMASIVAMRFASDQASPTAGPSSLLGRYRQSGRLGIFRHNRAWSAAIVWKDFHFVMGGWVTLVSKSLMYFGLFAISYLYDFRSATGAPMSQGGHESFQFALVFVVAADAGWVVARAVQHEIRHHTLSTLMMLPQPLWRLVYAKLIANLPALIPGVGAFVWSGMISPRAFFHSEDQFFVITCWMLSVPHLAALLSLYMRWGATPLAFGTTLGTLILSEMLFHRFAPGWTLREFGFYFVCPLFVTLIALCHALILRQLPQLAAR